MNNEVSFRFIREVEILSFDGSRYDIVYFWEPYNGIKPTHDMINTVISSIGLETY